MRLAALFLCLAFATPALAQVTPRTDIPALMKEAKAVPSIKAALEDRTRSTDALLRDEGRMTALILNAANARPGDKVLDVGSGGGYLALLFSRIVGEKGHVDIHNTPNWINQFPGMDPAVQKPRMNHANLGFITGDWHELGDAAGSYDVIVAGQVYHDAILEGGDVVAMNKRMFELLKSGGRLVIEDHDAIPTMHIGQQAYLHRIALGEVIAQLTAAGFRHADSIRFDSRYDDMRFNVFRPGVRGRTDRFIATFLKP